MLICISDDDDLSDGEALASQRGDVHRRDTERGGLLESLSKGGDGCFGDQPVSTGIAGGATNLANEAISLPGEGDRDARVRTVEALGYIDNHWSVTLGQLSVG
jgi:hypothetical protein